MTYHEKAAGRSERQAALNSVEEESTLHPNSGAAQRQRVLSRLREGPATTIDLRRDTDVMMPAARIYELRHKFDYEILLAWTLGHTECGRRHRVGLYTLLSCSARTEQLNYDRHAETQS